MKKLEFGRVYEIETEGGEKFRTKVRGEYEDEDAGKSLIIQDPEATGHKKVDVIPWWKIKSIK